MDRATRLQVLVDNSATQMFSVRCKERYQTLFLINCATGPFPSSEVVRSVTERDGAIIWPVDRSTQMKWMSPGKSSR